MTSAYIFDSSAVLACIQRETGSERFLAYLHERPRESYITAINAAEVLQKLLASGFQMDEAAEILGAFDLKYISITGEIAHEAAALWPLTKFMGASLADRICLAASIKTKALAITADKAWTRLNIPELQIVSIR